MTHQTKTEEWEKEFIHEFVNDHGNAWRPLRGLWVEDVIDFIKNLIQSVREEERSQYLEYDDAVCGGRLVFKGSRLPIDCILTMMAKGYEVKDIFESYPQLKKYLSPLTKEKNT